MDEDAPPSISEQVARAKVRAGLFGEENEAVRIGRFPVLRHLGRGGMGDVYAAYDEQLDRRVAIKVLSWEPRAKDRARVVREAKLMARLTHPNVVQVYEVGEAQGRLFIAMEYVGGTTLATWQGESRRSWRPVVSTYLQAGEGLAAAHAEGIVHRDFKPSNVMVEDAASDRLRVRVLDFGIARGRDLVPETVEQDASERGFAPSLDQGTLTATGALLGTPAYMAPEQFASANVGAAADQFSFCVALWEGLYGERPFSGDTLATLSKAVRAGERRRAPASSDVPAWLHHVVARGLAPLPEHRWPSMRALLEALRATPTSRRSRVTAVAVGVCVLGATAIGLAAVADRGEERCSGAAKQLLGIWDSARRAEIREAFVGSEIRYAPESWAIVRPQLDRWSESWSQMFTETCEATEVRKEQSARVGDLRMACLSRAKQSLVAVTGVLADGRPQTIEKSVQVVATLDSLAPCADIDGLLGRAVPPNPEDADEISRARGELAQAMARIAGVDYDVAWTLVSRAQQRADQLSAPLLSLEVARSKGAVQLARGNYAEAEVHFRGARAQAAELGDLSVLRRVTVDLVYLVGRLQARHAEGEELVDLARALSGRSDRDDGDLLGYAGNIYEAQGKNAKALREYEAALLRAQEQTSVRGLANAHMNLGNVLEVLLRYDEAIAHHVAAIELFEQGFGPHHPDVARARANLGIVFSNRGDHESSIEQLRLAKTLFEEGLGPRHPNVATAHNNLGVVLQELGRSDEALAEYRAALQIGEDALGPEHPEIGMYRVGVGGVLYTQGEHVAAQRQFAGAEEVFSKALGPQHTNTATARMYLAQSIGAQGRHGEAALLQTYTRNT
ncbi:MAG: tetratricopeptide repeat protein, partial [Nannocystaceae bacterium]|nr:tetratricopeptide repeat protein [Nannocystaceae bacterium]